MSSDLMENAAYLAVLRRRKYRHFFKVAMSRGLGSLGAFLPLGLKRELARFSPRLGYLLLSRGDFIVSDYWGTFSVLINVKSNIEREMLTGRYGRDVLEVVGRHVKAGDVCLDIGANVGAITLPLCHQVGGQGRVFGFEPGPQFFKRLETNLALNPELSKTAEVHLLGLSDKSGTLFWAEDLEFPGNAWLLGESGIPVEVTTLDSWVQSASLPRLDFIKIDVEGMELEVLSGAKATLEKYKPVILFESSLEFEAIRGRKVRLETEALLLALGYELYCVEVGEPPVPCRYPGFSANTLALPKRTH